MQNQQNQNPAEPEPDKFWGRPIYTYSRKQALDDGTLRAATPEGMAGAGWRRPYPDVAFTAAAWAKVVEWRPRDGTHQQQEARERDVLLCTLYAGMAAARKEPEACEFVYRICVVPKGGEVPVTLRLKAQCHDNDDGKPAVTIMLPEED